MPLVYFLIKLTITRNSAVCIRRPAGHPQTYPQLLWTSAQEVVAQAFMSKILWQKTPSATLIGPVAESNFRGNQGVAMRKGLLVDSAANDTRGSYESRHSSRIQTHLRHLHLRQQVRDALDHRPGFAGGSLLQLPPVLYRQAENCGYRRPRR